MLNVHPLTRVTYPLNIK